jgi:hypothetical protein
MESHGMLALVARPFHDLVRGQARVLGRWVDLVLLVAGLLLGWWLYVPLHELAHAAGCAAAGGRVYRLEIAPQYGAELLARVFPFVMPGGEYAGRLADFDTGGSDLVFLATDLAPFLLTLFPGVWLLRLAARQGRAFLFAVVLPLAMAPFLALPGDAYEIGSLAVSNLPPWSRAPERALLRGDDLVRQVVELEQALAAGRSEGGFIRASDGRAIAVPGPPLDSPARARAGLALATVLGFAWAWATYLLASLVASALGQRPLRAHVATGPETAVRGPDGWRADGPP